MFTSEVFFPLETFLFEISLTLRRLVKPGFHGQEVTRGYLKTKTSKRSKQHVEGEKRGEKLHWSPCVPLALLFALVSLFPVIGY